jgi:hypothetical protein
MTLRSAILWKQKADQQREAELMESDMLKGSKSCEGNKGSGVTLAKRGAG